MQSTPITGIKPLYISDKGIPKAIFSEVVRAASLINDGTNIEASLFFTYGGASPAYSFIGDWKSQSSQVLVNYKVGFIPPIPPPPPPPPIAVDKEIGINFTNSAAVSFLLYRHLRHLRR